MPILVLLLLTGSSLAADAPSKFEQKLSQLKSTCQSDIQKFCSDVTPGNGRVAACMNSKEDQLSPACAGAWSDAKAKISKKIDQAEVAFRKDCGSDVQKFCANTPSGKGRLLSCLDKHGDALSNSCKSFQAKLEQRVEKFVG
ncbi:MAG: cysteine rich repeat-containing protein [Bdellovibrionota bacterium]